MLQNVELTAAPHLPASLRTAADQHVLWDFALMLNGDLVVVEDNGELRLVTGPNIDE